jgi:hypothetical protein
VCACARAPRAPAQIGCGTPNKGFPPCSDCRAGLTDQGKCPGPGEQVSCDSNTTNILYSDSLDGPWQQFNAPFVKSDTMGTPYQVQHKRKTAPLAANNSQLQTR